MTTVIQKLQKQSDNAINLVKATINKLTALNEAIDLEMESNRTAINSLSNNNKELAEMQQHNKKIVTNFENLLK